MVTLNEYHTCPFCGVQYTHIDLCLYFERRKELMKEIINGGARAQEEFDFLNYHSCEKIIILVNSAMCRVKQHEADDFCQCLNDAVLECELTLDNLKFVLIESVMNGVYIPDEIENIASLLFEERKRDKEEIAIENCGFCSKLENGQYALAHLDSYFEKRHEIIKSIANEEPGAKEKLDSHYFHTNKKIVIEVDSNVSDIKPEYLKAWVKCLNKVAIECNLTADQIEFVSVNFVTIEIRIPEVLNILAAVMFDEEFERRDDLYLVSRNY